ncbi:hypothetical protein [Methyloradius palustris]|uniref:Uncharacterized protein n=1 Tax=Methyloradius palustris TaxID=2778876 RepID=A0A8D5FZA3_9PROT|nr:hypothetical protein [Methyloradius palustris]BCM24872.1 hypothetical protein ZMTM_11310 [Methyloradius palustris]
MTKQELEICINRALDKLFELDAYLLDIDSSERSMSHRLAIHLMSELPDYDVDCEYNRDGFDVKRLQLPERMAIVDDDIEAVTVFPDIIIHQRGTKDRNLLVIEMKKGSSTIDSSYDIRKLKAFLSELNYMYALHLRIGKCRNNEMARELVWVE